jgi:hypothetical protein
MIQASKHFLAFSAVDVDRSNSLLEAVWHQGHEVN